MKNSRKYYLLKHDLKNAAYEEFIIILLNKENKIIDRVYINDVDVRKIITEGLKNCLTASIITGQRMSLDNFHSSNYLEIIKETKITCNSLGIEYLDHVILSGNNYNYL